MLFVHHSSFSALILFLRGCGEGTVLKDLVLDLRTLIAAAGSIGEDRGWKDVCSAMPGTSVASLPGTGGPGYSGSYLSAICSMRKVFEDHLVGADSLIAKVDRILKDIVL